jgi:hypothetical protein
MPWFLGSTIELDNLTILVKKKKTFILEFPKAKNQRGKKCTLGELWIVHNFSSHGKNNYLSLRCTRKLSRY